MFSRTERCGSSACKRSAGTSTTPGADRVVRVPRLQRPPADADLAASPASAAPASTSNSSSCPWPSSAAIAEDLARRAARTRRPAASRPSEPSTSSAARARPRRRRRRGVRRRVSVALGRARERPRPEHVLDDPLLAALLRHERRRHAPPSRRIVARSHVGDHLGQAVRDEEHRAPPLAPARA